jgi:hypothetical protein
MKNLMLVLLAVAVLALSAVCAVQWRRSQAVQEHLATTQNALETELEASRALKDRVGSLEAQRARLGKDIDQFTGLVNDLRSRESNHASNVARLNGPGSTAPAAESDPGGSGAKGLGGMLAKMMKDPAMKEMLRSQQQAMVQKMYGPLLKDLNLNPEEKERFTQLLLDHQMSVVEQAGTLFGEGDAGRTEAAKAVKEKEKEMEGSLKALLGDDRFAQYQDYKTTLGERMQLDQFRQRLEGGTVPLQDDQMKALMQVMKEERDRVPPVVPNKSSENASDLAKSMTDEMIEKQSQWQTELNRRVQERAGQVLSPEQMKEFAGFQEQQINLQKAGMKMARELFGASKAAQTPAEVIAPPAK